MSSRYDETKPAGAAVRCRRFRASLLPAREEGGPGSRLLFKSSRRPLWSVAAATPQFCCNLLVLARSLKLNSCRLFFAKLSVSAVSPVNILARLINCPVELRFHHWERRGTKATLWLSRFPYLLAALLPSPADHSWFLLWGGGCDGGGCDVM